MARQEATNIVGTVYKITNIVNNKIYIGETVMPLQRRFRSHLTAAFRPTSNTYNYYFHKAIRKYGKENFVIEVLETVQGNFKKWVKRKIQRLECKYIQQYRSNDPTIGYNSDSGGLGGRIPNEQTRKKEKMAKLKDPNIKKRMAYARSFQDHKKSICQYNYYTGELINRFESIKEASEKLHLDSSGIVKCCKHPAKSKYLRIEKIKYTFRYENELYVPKYRFKMTLEDGSFVDYLVDTIHCEEKYHIDMSQIIRCCANKNKYAGKFNNLKMCWSYV